MKDRIKDQEARVEDKKVRADSRGEW